MTTSNTEQHSKITELEVIIPKDKFNDMGFIFRKLMETSLDVLKTIADNSKNFFDFSLNDINDEKLEMSSFK